MPYVHCLLFCFSGWYIIIIMTKEYLNKYFLAGVAIVIGYFLFGHRALGFDGTFGTAPSQFNQGGAGNVTVTGVFYALPDETNCVNGQFIEDPAGNGEGSYAIAQKMNRDVIDLRYDLRKYNITGYNQDGTPIIDNSSFTLITGAPLFGGSDF